VPEVLLSKQCLKNLPNLAKEVGLVDEWLAGKGRSVVRFSGTELKLRLMVEAENQDLVGKSLNRLQAAAQKDGILA
jgi:phosphoglucosamine mutase